MAILLNIADGALRPLDFARREVLAALLRVPLLSSALRRREPRLCLFASVGVVTALALTALLPGPMLVLGPAMFGVLHLASDVRYLVLRRSLPTAFVATLCIGVGALIALALCEFFSPLSLSIMKLEVGAGWCLVFAGALGGATQARDALAGRRVTLAIFALGASMAAALLHPLEARSLLAFGHNIVALVLFWVLSPPKATSRLIPLVGVAMGVLVLASGATLAWVTPQGPWAMRFVAEALDAIPFAPPTALRIGLIYVFLQAVHYGIWLVWIPQGELRTQGSLTFRMSLASARRDFGRLGLVLVVVCAVLMGIGSVMSVHRARAIYLSLASFHAYLEMALLAFFATRSAKRPAELETTRAS